VRPDFLPLFIAFHLHKPPNRSIISIFITKQLRKWNNLPKLSLGLIFLREHYYKLTGSVVDLWLWVCVHTTCGSYKSFKRVNTRSGWYLNSSYTRWRACIRRDLAASAFSPQYVGGGGGGSKHTHTAAWVHCEQCPCKSGVNICDV
jgi:hypothetical protein